MADVLSVGRQTDSKLKRDKLVLTKLGAPLQSDVLHYSHFCLGFVVLQRNIDLTGCDIVVHYTKEEFKKYYSDQS